MLFRSKIPARYVSGLLHQPEGESASHTWAEAYVEGLGWVGFDPSLQVCPTIHHIRVAAGLDYLSAAPVRGAHFGGEGETVEVRFDIGEKIAQRQTHSRNQSQDQSQH